MPRCTATRRVFPAGSYERVEIQCILEFKHTRWHKAEYKNEDSTFKSTDVYLWPLTDEEKELINA